jgi:hypothetical protein
MKSKSELYTLIKSFLFDGLDGLSFCSRYYQLYYYEVDRETFTELECKIFRNIWDESGVFMRFGADMPAYFLNHFSDRDLRKTLFWIC